MPLNPRDDRRFQTWQEPDESKGYGMRTAWCCHNGAKARLEEYRKAVEKIAADDRLSAIGRAERVHEAAKAVREGLANIRTNALKAAKTTLVEAREKAKGAPVEGWQAVLDYMRGREMRDTLLSMKGSLTETILEAAHSHDHEVLSALAGLPAITRRQLNTVHPDLWKLCEAALEVAQIPPQHRNEILELEEAIRTAEASLIASEEAIAEDMRAFEGTGSKSHTSGMADSEKAAFIGEHGFPAWQDFVMNGRKPEPVE